MPTSLRKKYGFENPFKVDPLVRKAMTHCHGRRVLDIGCGEGADTVFFARRGFSVTALDNNSEYLQRLRMYTRDHHIKGISIVRHNAVTYTYPRNTYDVVSCILAVCCMKRSDFNRIAPLLKRTVKPGGIIILSARNTLDPEFRQYKRSEKPIEPNTYRRKEDCCKFLYFLERGRLREEFSDFETLWEYEGFAPCKYNEHPRHGDSHLICRRPMQLRDTRGGRP